MMTVQFKSSYNPHMLQMTVECLSTLVLCVSLGEQHFGALDESGRPQHICALFKFGSNSTIVLSYMYTPCELKLTSKLYSG